MPNARTEKKVIVKYVRGKNGDYLEDFAIFDSIDQVRGWYGDKVTWTETLTGWEGTPNQEKLNGGSLVTAVVVERIDYIVLTPDTGD